jgi:inositol transport system ATP-binding protein
MPHIEVRDVSLVYDTPAGRVAGVAHASFDIEQSEFLCLVGPSGCGKSTLLNVIAGFLAPTAGEIRIGGSAVRLDSPAAAISRGLGFLTEDRKESGCFLSLSVLENLEISVLSRDFVRLGFVHAGGVRRACERMVGALRVKTPGLDERIENLSGGNQQKVLLGRWLLLEPRILILDEPTRGVDVGAKAEIHQLITRLAAAGTAVLMISSEMPEILTLSHRVMVMHEGRVTGILERAAATQVKIMDLAAR